MDPKKLEQLLGAVAQGRTSPAQAMKALRGLPFEDLGFAKVDHHRTLRQGMTEVVYAAGKTPQQVASIASALARRSPNILITRAEPAIAKAVRAKLRGAVYHPISRVITLRREPNDSEQTQGTVLVVSAGTSDMAVAEEAHLTADLLGSPVEAIHDVGVAGLHRLLAHRERLQAARVIIVVAGMEGALPSVVGGLVAAPVIAVPTSVGYGANFGGLTALLGMLNSCSSNVSVVNIDNGFGAGYSAALINRRFAG